jgi:hypothetical protein
MLQGFLSCVNVTISEYYLALSGCQWQNHKCQLMTVENSSGCGVTLQNSLTAQGLKPQ